MPYSIHKRVHEAGAVAYVTARVVECTFIAIGIVITVLVMSSSITTSILVPMVAAGVLSTRNAYPITLGANIGTTATALIASLAVVRPEGLVIALVHTLFNVCGILLLYPVPMLRNIPIRLAERTAAAAARRARDRDRRGFRGDAPALDSPRPP